jgi:hypothetical protein
MRANEYGRRGGIFPSQIAAQITGAVVRRIEAYFARRLGQDIRSGLILFAPGWPGDADLVDAHGVHFFEQVGGHLHAPFDRRAERRNIDAAHGANTSTISS